MRQQWASERPAAGGKWCGRRDAGQAAAQHPQWPAGQGRCKLELGQGACLSPPLLLLHLLHHQTAPPWERGKTSSTEHSSTEHTSTQLLASVSSWSWLGGGRRGGGWSTERRCAPCRTSICPGTAADKEVGWWGSHASPSSSNTCRPLRNSQGLARRRRHLQPTRERLGLARASGHGAKPSGGRKLLRCWCHRGQWKASRHSCRGSTVPPLPSHYPSPYRQ